MGGEDDFEDDTTVPNSTGQEPEHDEENDAVEGNEGEGPAESGPEGQAVSAEERQPEKVIGRAERAVLAAKNEARQAREEAARVARELDEFRRQQMEARRVNPEEEKARLAAMDPEERILYRMEQAEARNQQAIRNMELSFKEQADKAAFAVRLAQKPSLRKYEAKVEAIYADHMAQAKRNGSPVPDRDTVLRWVVGGAVVETADKAVEKSRKTGAANIARQTVKPVSSRGDVPSSAGTGKGKWDHLADVTF